MQTLKSGQLGSTHHCFAIALLTLVCVGCENQQPVIDALQKEKSEIEQQLTKASEQASQLTTDNATLQLAKEAAQEVAKQAQVATESALAAVKKQATAAIEAAKQAQVSGEKAINDAKKQASDALAKAVAEAKTQMASTSQKAKAQLDEVVAKGAALQKQLDLAKAKIAELEAAAQE
ncbi:MAG: hypothetical protein ABGX16_11795 [Pirellulales bacterium]